MPTSGVTSLPEALLGKIRRCALNKGGYNGLRVLVQDLQKLQQKHKIDKVHLIAALSSSDVFLSAQEETALVNAYEPTVQGIQALVNALVNCISAPRKPVVDEQYRKLDLQGSGCIDLWELRTYFCATKNPLVKDGKKTDKELLIEFCNQFNDSTNPTGVVTKEEFYAYYAGLSLVVDSDVLFDRICRSTWAEVERLRGSSTITGGSSSSSKALRTASRTFGKTIQNKISSTQMASTDTGRVFLRSYIPCDKTFVFLDIQKGDEPPQRVVIELFYEAAPKTCENFRCLCTGECGVGRLGSPLHYKGTKFHRIIPGLMLQGGDVVSNDGRSGESIYGKTFDDESFEVSHGCPGIVSMVSLYGPDTNNSQFFITTKTATYLDDRSVAFGKVVEGLDYIKILENSGTEHGIPVDKVVIVDCGQL